MGTHGNLGEPTILKIVTLVAFLLFTVTLAVEAQQTGKVYRIGFLRAGPPLREWVEAFQQGLRARGYIDGRNVVIEYRFTDGSVDELPRQHAVNFYDAKALDALSS